jgi:hypothetical protein
MLALLVDVVRRIKGRRAILVPVLIWLVAIALVVGGTIALFPLMRR